MVTELPQMEKKVMKGRGKWKGCFVTSLPPTTIFLKTLLVLYYKKHYNKKNK